MYTPCSFRAHRPQLVDSSTHSLSYVWPSEPHTGSYLSEHLLRQPLPNDSNISSVENKGCQCEARATESKEKAEAKRQNGAGHALRRNGKLWEGKCDLNAPHDPPYCRYTLRPPSLLARQLATSKRQPFS